MKKNTIIMNISVAIFTIVCCNQAMGQLASEKPVTTYYSKLAKEKLAEKQKSKMVTPSVNQQLPSKKPLTRQTMEAVEKRRQQTKM
jgi:hypothetical protein